MRERDAENENSAPDSLPASFFIDGIFYRRVFIGEQ
jgi:hypothetical protein